MLARPGRASAAGAWLRWTVAVAIAAWTLFLTYSLATEAHKTAKLNDILVEGRLLPELQVTLAAAAVVAIPALLAFMASDAVAALRGLRTVSSAAAIGAGTVLAVISGTGGGVLVFLLLLVWWVLAGEGVLRLTGADSPALKGVSRAAIGAGIGLALLSFGILALALLGMIGDIALAALLIAGLPLALRGAMSPAWPTLYRSWRHSDEAQEIAALDAERPGTAPAIPSANVVGAAFLEHIAITAVLVSLVVSFGASLAPQSAFDALHYHFAMPRYILDSGRFVERPDIIQSYFPLGLEMVYVPAMRLGGEVAATLVHWAMAPLTAVLLWSAGDRLFGRPAGAIATAAFSLMPLVIVEAASASSDLAFTFYLVGAAVMLADFAGGGVAEGERQRVTRAALIGAFGGLALAFKIVSGLYVIALAATFFAVLAWQAYRRLSSLRPAAAFSVAGLVTGLPWLLLRWIETGNPVFPLFNNVFKSSTWPAVNERFDLFLYGIGTSTSDFVSIWWEASLHPWLFGQSAPPWLFGLPFLGSLAFLLYWPAFRGDRRTLTWAVFAFGAFIAWFGWTQYHRYGLPPAALLALPAAGALAACLRQFGANAGAIVLAPVVAVWFAAAMINAFATNNPDDYPTDVLLKHETRDEYRERVLPDYAPLKYLESVSRGAEDEAFIFGYPFNYYVGNRVWDSILPAEISPPRRIAASGGTLASMAAALLRERVRYLVIDYNLAAQGTPQWLSTTFMSDEFLRDHTRQVFRRYQVSVYEVLAPD